MSRGVNKAILIGNLGADPEVRYTPSGDAVATLSLATSDAWTDKQTGELHEKTEWHRIVLWRRLAEIADRYLTKGSRIYVEGKLRTRKWQDQSGQDRYTTEIEARELQMLDGRRQTDEAAPAQERPARAGGDSGRSRDGRAGYGGSGQGQMPDDFNDDIPF